MAFSFVLLQDLWCCLSLRGRWWHPVRQVERNVHISCTYYIQWHHVHVREANTKENIVIKHFMIVVIVFFWIVLDTPPPLYHQHHHADHSYHDDHNDHCYHYHHADHDHHQNCCGLWPMAHLSCHWLLFQQVFLFLPSDDDDDRDVNSGANRMKKSIHIGLWRLHSGSPRLQTSSARWKLRLRPFVAILTFTCVADNDFGLRLWVLWVKEMLKEGDESRNIDRKCGSKDKIQATDRWNTDRYFRSCYVKFFSVKYYWPLVKSTNFKTLTACGFGVICVCAVRVLHHMIIDRGKFQLWPQNKAHTEKTAVNLTS